MKALWLVELGLDYCSLRYGETNGAGTCPAVLGVDSAIKCFNTISTCAVRDSFTNEPVTLRFAKPADYFPHSLIEAVASIADISYSPGTVSLGEDLGTRSSLQVTFNDHPHSDTGPGGDKYLSDRTYDPFKQGTFWGKFATRQRYVRGRPLRMINGLLGQDLADMETRHFLMESFEGPTLDGKFTITAKDALKLADADRAQAPLLSPGELLADIDEDDTTATLLPSGIGDSKYAASGYMNLGGSEIVSFTRSADTLTFTARHLFNTDPSAHSDGDRCQQVLVYDGEDPADIIYDLFTNYAGVDPAYINLPDWQAETAGYYRRLLTAQIPEPTSVNDLVSELIQQCGLAIWWDDLRATLKLQVLRAIPTDAVVFDTSNIIEGTLEVTAQPEKRVTQAWVDYGLRNPLKPLQADNFRAHAIVDDLDEEENQGQPSIRKIPSRWIENGGEDAALRLGQIIVGRFSQAPRHVKFAIARYGAINPELGQGARLVHPLLLQDATGAPANVPIQIVRITPLPDRYIIEAEEQLFKELSDDDPFTDRITITSNENNIDLRARHNHLYPVAVDGDTVLVVINAGVTVGSDSTSLPAFLNDDGWASGVTIHIIVRGRVQGRGGDGGLGNKGVNHAGHPGGIAFKTLSNVVLDIDAGGEVFGGGGGGSGQNASTVGYGGGGGAGTPPGSGGSATHSGDPGTADAGGLGAFTVGAQGGNPGQAGYGASSGAAGAAIDGISLCAVTNNGDIKGPQVN